MPIHHAVCWSEVVVDNVYGVLAVNVSNKQQIATIFTVANDRALLAIKVCCPKRVKEAALLWVAPNLLIAIASLALMPNCQRVTVELGESKNLQLAIAVKVCSNNIACWLD